MPLEKWLLERLCDQVPLQVLNTNWCLSALGEILYGFPKHLGEKRVFLHGGANHVFQHNSPSPQFWGNSRFVHVHTDSGNQKSAGVFPQRRSGARLMLDATANFRNGLLQVIHHGPYRQYCSDPD
jgi:hypothetical protein